MPYKKVLIVQEDTGISFLIKKILETSNAEYTLAHDYDTVETCLENDCFDIVLTDITIDGISTYDYIEYIHNKLPKASILIITAMEQKSVKKSIENLGIEEYINLPLDITDLVSKMNKYL